MVRRAVARRAESPIESSETAPQTPRVSIEIIVRRTLFAVACIACGAVGAHAQQALNWAADDGTRVAKLAKEGSRIDGRHLTMWIPPSFPRADAEALARRLDPAVGGLWERVGVHDWQRVPKGKITFYLVDDAFVSHASGRSAVFVPMARVRDGRAPYLHEATHELLASKQSERGGDRSTPVPLWMSEGMADYVARLVAQDNGITEQGPFGTPTLDGVDDVCAGRARTPDGAAMMPYVGGAGRPDVLFTTDRQRFAPTFYACSLSFTKYVAGRVGLDTLVGLFAFPPREMIKRLDRVAATPLATVRSEWLRSLKLAP
jgi:hypothetical protein